ncbi:unnamed protein product [Rotaria magnacalcarata]|uniref:Carrier domain-containing protein n=2 Tax=Rotaria magnacalcarata TaxID=392030 RepID=A0A814ZA35_9BILA|nr:unnamed protein product [Rotaria magnacalcarata]
MGRLLPNYCCMILDEFLQPVVVDQEGEFYVGGAGVFAGYLDLSDLTTKALMEINGRIFYRTGDLVRLENDGLLYFVGRKDYQVKIRGQRIELDEIEKCLLNFSSHITACVVIKGNNNHLVAYLQSSGINREQLQEHCSSWLPQFMIPLFFIEVKQLPLNGNGKIDRKMLPSPEFSDMKATTEVTYAVPRNQMEDKVHDLWCKVLERNDTPVPITANFFTIGGHSLLIIQLYYFYQSCFGFDTRMLTVAPFVRHATIVEHAEILQNNSRSNIVAKPWLPLHIKQGKSFFGKNLYKIVIVYCYQKL